MKKNDQGEEILGYSGGMAITQSIIEELAAEAERGYTREQLRRGRPYLGSAIAKTVQVKLSPELHVLLEKRVAAEGKSRSEVVREALTKYLAS
ncbi:MAG: ribbon-helix-helix domain-containing protein [Candidatus Nanopelagicales bacterium]|nr:ribbon-helix-helix domain-containing protein [Candidatus Nanopelagicales bacterium]